MGIPEQIAAVLALDPAAEAIEFEGRWWTWGQLESLSAQLSARLERAGLPEGAPIGLLLRNRPEMVAALLGVLRGRRCVVTVNPHQGREKLAADLEQLACPALVSCEEDATPDLLEVASRQGALALTLAPNGELAPLAGSGEPVQSEARSGVAVEMLTSGTTGAPKRVQLHYAALEHSLLGAKHYEKDKEAGPRLRRGVAIIAGPLVHVGGLWRTLQCIADGRRFALLGKFSVEAWHDCVVRHRPNTVSLVPAALRMVLDARFDPEDLSSIRTVVSGTAPLDPANAEAFEAQYGIPVLTSYGATEFAGGVAGWNLRDHQQYRAEKRGSVGRAHPGCSLRVVDPESGESLPAGSEGLLEVHSAQLGPDADWVRTTDLARMDEDGFLWILGRADAAIIRGGFKVHPGEVQAVLEDHPAVHEASVVGLPDTRLGEVPVAAVTLVAGAGPIDEEDLREHAGRHLARYQIPARIRIVEALPRTPSLKVSQPGVRALLERP